MRRGGKVERRKGDGVPSCVAGCRRAGTDLRIGRYSAGLAQGKPAPREDEGGAALRGSEVAPEFAEGWQDDEFAGSRDDDLMLQLPSVFVRNVDGVQTNLHRGVDVAAGAVADHPGVGLDDLVFVDQFA